MKIQNPRRRFITAVAAATIAFAAAGGARAGAVGGPEYGIVLAHRTVPVIGWPGVDPQIATLNPERWPLLAGGRAQLRAAARTGPVGGDEFDWTDAGIGAAGAAMFLGVLGGAVLLVRAHAHPAHS